MKILAVIPESDISERILDHLGIGNPEPRAVGPPSAQFRLLI